MKRFLRYILPLALVLFLAAPVWSAEITLTNQLISSIGSLRMVTGTASVASGDTFVVPLGTVVTVNITARNALGNVNPVVWHSLSGTTITIFTEGLAAGGGSMTYQFEIKGY